MSPKFLGVIDQMMPQGGSKQREIYRFPKREATLMAMSYSAEISAQVYDKMEALEKQLLGQTVIAAPQTLRQALLLALEQEERIEEQQRQLALAAPKVAFVDNFVGRDETYTATAIAKKLGVSAQTVNNWLVDKGALFTTRKHLKQWYIDKGYGVEKFVGDRSGDGRVYEAVCHTSAGAEWVLSNFDIKWRSA